MKFVVDAGGGNSEIAISSKSEEKRISAMETFHNWVSPWGNIEETNEKTSTRRISWILFRLWNINICFLA